MGPRERALLSGGAAWGFLVKAGCCTYRPNASRATAGSRAACPLPVRGPEGTVLSPHGAFLPRLPPSSKDLDSLWAEGSGPLWPPVTETR